MDQNEKLVVEFLEKSGKAFKTAEIAEATGIDKKEVSKIIKNLKKVGIIETPKRCYYQLKKKED